MPEAQDEVKRTALERFTGYVGQSRSRLATHTWNVSRLPEVDHGGVLADQRTPEREVLDALLRVPDTGFATHDDPRCVERLLAERAELQAVLRLRPQDRRHELRRAELELQSAEKERYWANYRLHAAHEKLAGLGPLSQLRRHGRHEKAKLIESIERFQDDVRRAEHRVARCEDNLDGLRDSETHRREWDALHGHHQKRLEVVEAELAEFSPIEPSGSSRAACLTTQAERTSNESLTRWAERIAEVAGPRLPGHDSGLGMDLGL